MFLKVAVIKTKMNEEEYFAFSQQIKKEIVANTELMTGLQEHIAGIEREFLGSGSVNSNYRLGRLHTGLWIAIRQISALDPSARQITVGLTIYETYAQQAESLSCLGKRATRFCVGVKSRSPPDALLLVEDLTNGGEYTITHKSGENTALREKEGKQEEVHMDLDGDISQIRTDMSLKYMTNENVILL